MHRTNPGLRRIAVTIALAALGAGAAAQARISDNVVKIGVLTDLSGVSSDNAGKGSIVAAQLAIDEFSKDRKVLRMPIELVSADSQGKTDIGATKAREWFDQDKVDMITDLTYSNVALAVTRIADEKKKLAMVTGAGASTISDDQCTAHSVHWMYDTYSLANTTESALIKKGMNSWYFITADYDLGNALEKDGARHAAGAGQDTGGVQGRMGSVQGARDDPGRQGLRAAGRFEVPAGQALTRAAMRSRVMKPTWRSASTSSCAGSREVRDSNSAKMPARV